MGELVAIVALCIPIAAIISRVFRSEKSPIAQAIARRMDNKDKNKNTLPSESVNGERLELMERQVEQLTEEVTFLNRLLEDKASTTGGKIDGGGGGKTDDATGGKTGGGGKTDDATDGES